MPQNLANSCSSTAVAALDAWARTVALGRRQCVRRGCGGDSVGPVTAKAYIFSVWAPEGDDCPPAVAAVVTGSLSEARTALRRAAIKLVRKDPLLLIREADAVEEFPTDQVVWRYDDDEIWRPV